MTIKLFKDINIGGHNHKSVGMLPDRLTLEPVEQQLASRPQGRKMGDNKRFKVRPKLHRN